jgi:hypothetical protein
VCTNFNMRSAMDGPPNGSERCDSERGTLLCNALFRFCEGVLGRQSAMLTYFARMTDSQIDGFLNVIKFRSDLVLLAKSQHKRLDD